MISPLRIGDRLVGAGAPVWVVAEMSANHNQNFDEAVALVHAAKEAGADAIKLQTYTPETLTLESGSEYFRVGRGTIWEGRTLFDLYTEAATPWAWQPRLKAVANGLGMELFSTPFDPSSVDFLEEMGTPAHKVASFELVDIPLIRRVASTGKPVIMSTGMASLSEIDEAVTAAREAGASQIALLKCNSAYPAPPEEMNLRTIPHLAQAFDVVVGLSDHTLGIEVAVAAVAVGAAIVEKHLTLSRSVAGPDSSFSLEPHEFKAMVGAIRTTEKALGQVSYGVTEGESASRIYRRSLFVTEDVQVGGVLTEQNVRSIRPAHGLHPRYLTSVLGRRAATSILRGTPLSWDLIASGRG